MKKTYFIITVLFIVILFYSCANVVNVHDCVKDEPYGFWSGLWHGFTAIFSFFGSLFFDNIAIYAVNNNGNWYNFGFVLGSGILGFGTSKVSKKK